MEKVRPWCGQPSDWGQLKNKNKRLWHLFSIYRLLISLLHYLLACARCVCVAWVGGQGRRHGVVSEEVLNMSAVLWWRRPCAWVVYLVTWQRDIRWLRPRHCCIYFSDNLGNLRKDISKWVWPGDWMNWEYSQILWKWSSKFHTCPVNLCLAVSKYPPILSFLVTVVRVCKCRYSETDSGTGSIRRRFLVPLFSNARTGLFNVALSVVVAVSDCMPTHRRVAIPRISRLALNLQLTFALAGETCLAGRRHRTK